MNAKYFYERLKGYPKESEEAHMYHYGYSNGMVSIHHKNSKNDWYIVCGDGSVYCYSRYDNIVNKLTIDELEGDDFELFEIVQIIKSGYLVLDDAKSEYDVKRIISKLYWYIDSFDDPYEDINSKDIPTLCGASSWDDGVTDRFGFYATTNVELKLTTIKNLCKENVSRKYFGAKVFPFKRYMNNWNSIYVVFIMNMRNLTDDKISQVNDQTLEELLLYMKGINIKCKWVDCNLRHPIYY